MCKQEDEERGADPGPPAFDEEDVEEVVLAGEVGGREVRVLDVRVAEGVVGRGAGLRGEEREEGAEDEDERVER